MISKGELKKMWFDEDEVESFGFYPFNIAFLRRLQTLKFHRRVTYIVGENGMGKSTLIEAIAIANGFNPEGGTRNFNFSTRPSHSELYKCLKFSKGLDQLHDGFFLRSESFFNVATEIDNLDKEPSAGLLINSYGGKSLHEQSHGESFWALFMNRFSNKGLYILDEPEAALSPTRQMALLVRMRELLDMDSQFIIATHSPIVMAYPDSLIYEISEIGINIVEYKDSESYKITKEFLNNTEEMLRQLLD